MKTLIFLRGNKKNNNLLVSKKSPTITSDGFVNEDVSMLNRMIFNNNFMFVCEQGSQSMVSLVSLMFQVA